MEGGIDQTQHQVGTILGGHLQTRRVDKSVLGDSMGKGSEAGQSSRLE